MVVMNKSKYLANRLSLYFCMVFLDVFVCVDAFYL